MLGSKNLPMEVVSPALAFYKRRITNDDENFDMICLHMSSSLLGPPIYTQSPTRRGNDDKLKVWGVDVFTIDEETEEQDHMG